MGILQGLTGPFCRSSWSPQGDDGHRLVFSGHHRWFKVPICPSGVMDAIWCMMQSRNRIDVDRPRGGSCPMSGKSGRWASKNNLRMPEHSSHGSMSPKPFLGGYCYPKYGFTAHGFANHTVVGLNFPNEVAISQNKVIYGKSALQPNHSGIVLCHSRPTDPPHFYSKYIVIDLMWFDVMSIAL